MSEIQRRSSPPAGQGRPSVVVRDTDLPLHAVAQDLCALVRDVAPCAALRVTVRTLQDGALLDVYVWPDHADGADADAEADAPAVAADGTVQPGHVLPITLPLEVDGCRVGQVEAWLLPGASLTAVQHRQLALAARLAAPAFQRLLHPPREAERTAHLSAPTASDQAPSDLMGAIAARLPAVEGPSDLMRSIVDAMEDVVFTLDTHQRHTGIYGTWAQRAGLAPEAFIGRAAREILGPEAAALHEAAAARALGGQVTAYDWSLETPGGTRYYHTVLSPLRDESGVVVGLVGVGRDVTDRVEAEQQARRAEAEARRLAEENRALLDNAYDAVAVWDEQARLTYVNRRFTDLLGYSPEEVLGKPTWSFSHLDEVAAQRERATQRLRGVVPPSSYVHRLVTRDGRVVYVETSVSVREQDGRIVGGQALLRDVTERVQAEAALREAEARFRALIQHAADVVVVLDAEGCIRYASPSAQRVLQHAPLHLVGRQALDFVHPDDQERIRQMLAARLRTPGLGAVVETRVVAGDGTWRMVEFVGHNLLENPDVAGLVITLRDITARKQAEAALEASEERLALVVRATSDAIWDWNLRSNEVWWNEGVRTLFGYTVDEVDSDISWWEMRIHPEDRARVLGDIRGAIAGTATFWQDEYRYLHADGVYRMVLDRGYIVRDPRGQAVRMVGAMIDITARKHAEAALRSSEAHRRAIVDATPDCIKLLARNGTLLEMNPAGLAMVEADSVEQLIGAEIGNVVVPEHRADFNALVAAAFRGQSARSEFDIVGLRGTRRSMESHVVPLRDEHGSITAALAITRDITDHRMAKDQLLVAVRDVREMMRRERAARTEAEALAALLREAATEPDTEAVVRRISEAARELVGCDYAGITTYLPDGGRVWRGMAGTRTRAWQEQRSWRGRGLSFAAVQTGRTMVTRAADPATGVLPRTHQAEGGRTVLATPLRGPDARAIGVLALGWRTDVVPSDDQVRLAETLAHHAGSVLSAALAREAVWREADEKRAVLDQMGDAVLATDAEGRITLANAAAVEQLGMSQAELRVIRPGQQPWRIYADDGRYLPPEQRPIRRALEGLPTASEFRLVRPDGQERWIWITATPLREPDGAIRGVIVVSRDTTERRRALEQQAHLAAIVDASEDAIYGRALDGTITSWNPGSEKLFGYTAEEIVGQPLARLVPPELREGLREIDARIRAGEFIQHLETIRLRKDGTTVPVSLTVSPIRDANGVVVGAAAIARDISALKAAEEARLQAREAQAREQMKDELMSVVSHELRTPLASLVGFTELMLHRQFSEERQREFLQTMHVEGMRLTALINNFLDLQRIDSGRFHAHPRPTDLLPLLRHAVAVAGEDPLRPIELLLPEHLPTVQIDPPTMQQVLANLLSNARKYSPHGGAITITAAVRDREVHLAVSDRGLGLPPEALPHLFKRFFRVDNSDRRSIKGSGLGLAISKRLLEAQGGRLWVESEGLGRGSTFICALPIAPASVEGADNPHAAPQAD